jgi:hypothetical protein
MTQEQKQREVAGLKPCAFCGCTAFDTTEFKGALDSIGCSECGALMLRTDKRPNLQERWNCRKRPRKASP